MFDAHLRARAIEEWRFRTGLWAALAPYMEKGAKAPDPPVD
jgi:hypothetical protein